MSDWVSGIYLATAICFIVSLKLMNSPRTARLGNGLAALGMGAAIVVTFFLPGFNAANVIWILVALLIGTVIGFVSARQVQMTAMPQMIALFNGLGGGAVALVATIEFMRGSTHPFGSILTIVLSTLIGAISFSGSMIAYGKLQELIPGRSIGYPGQKPINLVLFASAIALTFFVIGTGGTNGAFVAILIVSLLLGVLAVLPIGGADMPVVISLLNSLTGVAAGLAGFVMNNTALLIGGGLVGASGLILTLQMCKAMNRSLESVLFGALGGNSRAAATAASLSQGNIRSYSVEDAAIVFASANSVIIVPGYGMAVAQAQHAVKDLANKLAEMGIEVKYAIHPVAGRMPGHMNVLLAEADVSYDQLFDLDEINSSFPETDVALVIGANDVTNPAARYDRNSPIFGMPILDVDKAKTCMVSKRSMNPGYAGVDNELYAMPNTVMLFGDAKATVSKLTAALNDF
ncbi:MAG: NAD(P)(+) transhydrogenase (Re/Si-specific) subunit beta [Fimbriimonadales bacterium]